MTLLKTSAAVGVAFFLALPAVAKLPAPSDEAKAKAAEAAAKAAYANKVGAYQLCKSMDRVAVGYFTQAKKDGKEVKPAVSTEACADPGIFSYTPPAAVSPPLEAAGAHSPAAMAVAPPSSATPQAAQPAKK